MKRVPIFCLPLALGLGACGSDGRYSYGSGYSYSVPECSTPTRSGVIDTGAAIDVTPGDGVGVFVEYEGNGRWHVYMTCDTNVSNLGCNFDAIVQTGVGSLVQGVSRDSLESNDVMQLLNPSTVRLLAVTNADFDGIVLDTDPGASLSVDVNLDGACASQYVDWIESSVVHRGARSKPFELVPTSP